MYYIYLYFLSLVYNSYCIILYIYIYDTVYNCTLWYYHGGVYATVTSYFTNSHFHVEYYCYAIVKNKQFITL